MTRPTKRSALCSLAKPRLTSLVERYGVDISPRSARGKLIDALARAPKVMPFAELLGLLARDELVQICRDHKLGASGLTKAAMIARILDPKGVEAPAAGQPAPAPKPNRSSSPKQNHRPRMAVKKSELYSSLWASCDELRGGMDASQYKDYVLVLLFVKYVSDKYADTKYAPITIPKGASFADMVALKGKPDIGDQINKKIITPLKDANQLSDMPDFNDATKLGSGKEMVQRLDNLIGIFQNPALDFSRNQADGDDILGDAYEYLMRHFATESGKSKGQFYTPAEVSRVISQVIGIREAKTTTKTTVYDPPADRARCC